MMEDLPRWIAVVVLTASFCVFALYNAVGVWERNVRGAPAPSLAPIFGGLFGLAAVLAAPLGTIAQRLSYAWIPLLLDVSIPITVLALYKEIRRR